MSAFLQKLFLPVSEAYFSFLTMPGNAMFAFKASLVRFTLRQVGSFVQNYLFARIHSTQKDLHEIIFAGGIIGNKFVSKFKMSLWEKMLLSIKTAHFNFTLICLNNKSSPQFIRLNGTKCRLSKVIVHLWILEGQGKPFFFCRSATRTYGDVTEAELIMTS